MISYTFGTFVLGYWLGLIVGRSAYHKRSLAKGGNIGTSPLILNEGRTIRGNGVDGPYQPKPGITPKPQSPPPPHYHVSVQVILPSY